MGCAVAGSRSSCDISTTAFGISGKGDAVHPEKSADLGRSTAFGRKLAAWLCGGIGGVSGNVPSMVFGTVPGMMVAWFGNVIGASICFALSNLLFCRKSLCLPLQSAVQRWGSIGCVVLLLLFPSAGGIAGYLMGFGGLRWKQWFLGISAGEFAITLAYAFCCSPYVTALPNNIAWVMRLIAVILVVGTIAVQRLKNSHQKIEIKK